MGRDEDPDPVLFSTDPDPTCNNGFKNYFYLLTKFKSEFKHKMIVIISNFIPTYLKHKYIYFVFRSDPDFFC